MYPELFTIPFTDWPISSFGAAMATAFLVGYWIAIPRMREEGLNEDDAANMLVFIMAGGVLGAKLYYAIDFSVREGMPFWELLFSRAGMVFYGGLMGGALAGVLGCLRFGIRIEPFANAVCISLAVGQAIGRVGCFLVGDDYGRATDLPWGVAFPQGLPPVDHPVHPTMLYETAWLSLVKMGTWWNSGPSLITTPAACIPAWRVRPSSFLACVRSSATCASESTMALSLGSISRACSTVAVFPCPRSGTKLAIR